MSFQVVIRQFPKDMPIITSTTEMSSDSLQLKLIKDIDGILSINGQKVTLAQKEALRALGQYYEVTNLVEWENGAVLVVMRREGFMRDMTIDLDGHGVFVDGDGPKVEVSRQDPLNSKPWGDGLLTSVVE